MLMRRKESIKRTEYFDYLRVFAIFSVIVLHTAAENWYNLDVNSHEWSVFNTYNAAVRWAVPIFIMISGALFLNKECSIKKIYTKYVLRIITAFIFWGFIYSVSENAGGGITNILSDMVTGHYHMWFLPMIAGLYILVPILKKIVESTKLTEYFLILSFVFAFLSPQLVVVTTTLGNKTLITAATTINTLLSNMEVQFTLGYTGYFIGGFYLNNKELNKKTRMVIYALGVVGFFATILLSAFVSRSWQYPDSTYFEKFTINILLASIAVFVWFKYNAHKFTKIIKPRVIVKLSQYSFGVYLVHALVLEKLDLWFGLNTLSMNALLSVPIIGIIVFIISVIISAIINQMPVLKKYIV